MNDFTKEELIWLEEDIRYGIDEYQQPEIAYKIHDKIICMIDSYCEHEDKETIQTSQTSDAKSVFQNRCKKCRRIV